MRAGFDHRRWPRTQVECPPGSMGGARWTGLSTRHVATFRESSTNLRPTRQGRRKRIATRLKALWVVESPFLAVRFVLDSVREIEIELQPRASGEVAGVGVVTGSLEIESNRLVIGV